LAQYKSKSENAVDTLENGDTTENKKKGVDWGLIGLTVFTLAYILSPIDIIPESLVGPLGFVDDAALVAYLVKRIIDKIRK
jgi:uncharacterized membrane protein YkvA (DUF1232 family)